MAFRVPHMIWICTIVTVCRKNDGTRYPLVLCRYPMEYADSFSHQLLNIKIWHQAFFRYLPPTPAW
uniref:Uncharacterized protein n=1 Tax=Candidatus Caldatribacterium californiense TaxID=1454726 RepID=A0A7V4DGS2_9BACT